MGVLKKKDKDQLKKAFASLPHEVRLVVFTQQFECEYCRITRELVEEVASLSDKINVEIHDFVQDADAVKKYNIQKIPAVALLGERDYGIRFYGVPAGYEFTTLIEDIISVGRRDPHLPKEVLELLAMVDRPVHLQALVSPTCPLCPQAVRIIHRFAMASEHITADMVEIAEFPQLVQKYDVHGVPKTIINEDFNLVGVQPEMAFALKVLEAIGKPHRHDEPSA